MPARATLLKGYKRLPGSARRYLTPSGKEISRYEYDKRRLRRQGFSSTTEARKFRATKDWRYWRFNIRSHDRRQDTSSFGSLFRDAAEVKRLRDAGYKDTDPELNDPEGPLSRLLVAVGRRDPEWEWDVGDTASAQT